MYVPDPVRLTVADKIRALFERTSSWLTAADIARRCACSPNGVKRAIGDLVLDGTVESARNFGGDGNGNELRYRRGLGARRCT